MMESMILTSITLQLYSYIKTNNLRFPLVLGRPNGGNLEPLMNAQDLAGCSKNHSVFLELLRARCQEKAINISGTTTTEIKL